MDYVLLTFTFSIFSNKFSKILKCEQHETDFRGKNEFAQQFLKFVLELLFLVAKARMRGGLPGSPGKRR